MSLTTIHASPVVVWRHAFLRIMLCATGVGLMMSFVGAFALNDAPTGIRTTYLVVAWWISGVLDTAAYTLALRLAWANGHTWTRILASTVIAAVPAGLVIWASIGLFGRTLNATTLLIVFFNALVMTGAFIAAFVAPAIDTALRRAEADALAQETAISNPKPANFMERLPRHLRDGQLWALKAEDHYLQAITSKGEALIRLRMADALRELGGTAGAQTHRSWWVARDAVKNVRKGEGKVSLALPDGREIPVSRAAARELREANWF